MEQYVFLDSTHRNRNTYPNPASFTTEVSTSGVQGAPPPLPAFVRPTPQNPFPTQPTVEQYLGNPRDPILVNFPYHGRIQNSQLSTDSVVTLASDEINLDDFFVGMSITVTDASGGGGTEQTYAVTDYNGVTKELSILPNTWGVALNAEAAYEIRPVQAVTGLVNTLAASGATTLVLDSGNTAPDDYYNGGVITVTTESGDITRAITDYVNSTNTITIGSSWGVSVAAGSPYKITGYPRPEGDFAISASTSTTVTLTGGSSVDDFYNGKWLRITDATLPDSGTDAYTSIYNEVYRIIDYVGSTGVLTISGNFSSVPNTSNNTVEIYEYEENFRGLKYPGRQSRQAICYQVSLEKLTLPTGLIERNSSGDSSTVTITQLPYVIVEFYSHNNPAHHPIITNNPNISKATFIVPMDVRTTSSDGAFTYVDSSMKQLIKFQNGDSLTFRVLTPEGEVLTYVNADYSSPYPPLWFRQVNALFGLTMCR